MIVMQEILNALTSVHWGLLDCEYDNNLLKTQDHTEAINELKHMVKNDTEDDHPILSDMIKERLGMRGEVKESEAELVKKERTPKRIENLSQKRFAYYAGALTSDFL